MMFKGCLSRFLVIDTPHQSQVEQSLCTRQKFSFDCYRLISDTLLKNVVLTGRNKLTIIILCNYRKLLTFVEILTADSSSVST